MKRILSVIISIMILSAIFCGCEKKQPTAKKDDKTTLQTQQASEKTNNETELTLYVATSDAMLKKIMVKTKLGEKTKEEAVVDLLVKGVDDDGLISVIPSETKINSVEIADGTCTVDLSSDFSDEKIIGTADRTLAVYSIVNSLAELDEVENVQFLIEGEKQEIFGDFLFDEPFVADETLISK